MKINNAFENLKKKKKIYPLGALLLVDSIIYNVFWKQARNKQMSDRSFIITIRVSHDLKKNEKKLSFGICEHWRYISLSVLV